MPRHVKLILGALLAAALVYVPLDWSRLITGVYPLSRRHWRLSPPADTGRGTDSRVEVADLQRHLFLAVRDPLDANLAESEAGMETPRPLIGWH